MRSAGARRLVLACVALLAPATARAHLVNTGLGAFYDGVSHLVLTPEDVLPALALALLAGQRGAAASRVALFLLPGAWLLGGLTGLAWSASVQATALSALLLVALGGLVSAEARLPPAAVGALAACLGTLHGFRNGAAMAQAGLGALGLAGIVSVLLVVVAFGAAAVVAIRVPRGRIVVRVAGSWIAAIGLLALGWAARGARG